MSIGDAINDGAEPCLLHGIWLGRGERCPVCGESCLLPADPRTRGGVDHLTDEMIADASMRRPGERYSRIVGGHPRCVDCGKLSSTRRCSVCATDKVQAKRDTTPSPPPEFRFLPQDDSTPYQPVFDQQEAFLRGKLAAKEQIAEKDAKIARLQDCYDQESRRLARALDELKEANGFRRDIFRDDLPPWDSIMPVRVEDVERLRAVVKDVGLVEEGEDVFGALIRNLPSRIAASVRPASAHTLADALGDLDAARKKQGELEGQVAWLKDDVRRLSRDLELARNAAKGRRR